MQENSEEKLQRFTSAILIEATAEADAIYEEIKAESEEVLSAADSKALAEAFRFIKSEAARIAGECGRRLSRAVMANKREIFLRREAMADEVMAAVEKKLEVFTGTPDYLEYLKDVLTFVLTAFDGDITVWLRSEDMPLAAGLAGVPSEYSVTFAEGTFSRGGLEASCPEKNLRADATFDAKIHSLRGPFAALFGLKLED